MTVGEVATALGVTIRTLHHWDDIGLATPSLRTTGDYRLYTADDLDRLQRIVAYREVGIGLDRIRRLLDDPTGDIPTALAEQRAQLAERIDRLQQLSEQLERMITAHERGPLLTDDQQREIIGPQWNPRWPAAARRRYGDTPQWQQFAERAADRDPADWQHVVDAVNTLDRAMAEAMADGVQPGSPRAHELVRQHRELFSASFFPLTRQMQVCVGRQYASDPSYAAHYDSISTGLADWFRRSVDAEARAHGIDPDTATWE